MRFSVWPSFERTWDEVLDLASWADSTGWHGIWFADHYMANTPDDTVSDAPALECWSVLAGLATATQHLRLGSLVSPTTVHHPALLAHRAATIDHISHGRFVLGLGAGWQVNEHRAYGIDLPAPGPRVSRFAEAIEVVHRLLDEPRVTFDGRWFHLTDAPCEPKPVQQPLPIMVGTGSPRMLRIAARWAHEWNTWGNADTVRARTGEFWRACELEGRDPSTVRRSVQALVMCSDDPATTEQRRAAAPPDRSIVGSTAEVIDHLGELAGLGVDEFIVLDTPLGRSPSERRDGYEHFWAEVAPALS